LSTTSQAVSLPAIAQRRMYRELREEAARQQRARQQKIARLVALHGQRPVWTTARPIS